MSLQVPRLEMFVRLFDSTCVEQEVSGLDRARKRGTMRTERLRRHARWRVSVMVSTLIGLVALMSGCSRVNRCDCPSAVENSAPGASVVRCVGPDGRTLSRQPMRVALRFLDRRPSGDLPEFVTTDQDGAVSARLLSKLSAADVWLLPPSVGAEIQWKPLSLRDVWTGSCSWIRFSPEEFILGEVRGLPRGRTWGTHAPQFLFRSVTGVQLLETREFPIAESGAYRVDGVGFGTFTRIAFWASDTELESGSRSLGEIEGKRTGECRLDVDLRTDDGDATIRVRAANGAPLNVWLLGVVPVDKLPVKCSTGAFTYTPPAASLVSRAAGAEFVVRHVKMGASYRVYMEIEQGSSGGALAAAPGASRVVTKIVTFSGAVAEILLED